MEVFGKKQAFLALKDGTLFQGFSDSEEGIWTGEVIFNTSMTGYQEICTDPSYANQIIVFTNPHIGNTGVNEHDNESDRCWVQGVVVRAPSKRESHWQAKEDLPSFLQRRKVPLLYGIDTRRITNHIRQTGAQMGALVVGPFTREAALAATKQSLALPDVSTRHPYTWNDELSQDRKVYVIDFGVKRTILRTLSSLNCSVRVIPPSYPIALLLDEKPEGVILSNGPGNPERAKEYGRVIRTLVHEEIPLYGICFGCQLLAQAFGGQTIKMKLGHHGANHPVLDLKKRKAFITSQNHDFMVNIQNLPQDLEVTHLSLVDHTLEGFRLKNLPAFGFQGHPEGGPGPFDLCHLFIEFINSMDRYAQRSLS